MTKTIHSEGHEALCAELIRLRKARNLTQADVATRLGCHQSMIARVESGQRRIDVVELIVITRALETGPLDVVEFVQKQTRHGQCL